MTTIRERLDEQRERLLRLEGREMLRTLPAFDVLLEDLRRFKDTIVKDLLNNPTAGERHLAYTQGVVDSTEMLIDALPNAKRGIAALQKEVRQLEQEYRASEAGTLVRGRDVSRDLERHVSLNPGR